MKTLKIITLLIISFIFISCSTQKNINVYDDIYYTPTSSNEDTITRVVILPEKKVFIYNYLLLYPSFYRINWYHICPYYPWRLRFPRYGYYWNTPLYWGGYYRFYYPYRYSYASINYYFGPRRSVGTTVPRSRSDGRLSRPRNITSSEQNNNVNQRLHIRRETERPQTRQISTSRERDRSLNTSQPNKSNINRSTSSQSSRTRFNINQSNNRSRSNINQSSGSRSKPSPTQSSNNRSRNR